MKKLSEKWKSKKSPRKVGENAVPFLRISFSFIVALLVTSPFWVIGQTALVVLRVLRGSALVASGWGLCILQILMWFCWRHQVVDFNSQWSSFMAKCEAVEMRLSTSNSETMALSHKAGVSSLGWG